MKTFAIPEFPGLGRLYLGVHSVTTFGLDLAIDFSDDSDDYMSKI
jgi:hypothetical protein